jgi:hypothetical protein
VCDGVTKIVIGAVPVVIELPANVGIICKGVPPADEFIITGYILVVWQREDHSLGACAEIAVRETELQIDFIAGMRVPGGAQIAAAKFTTVIGRVEVAFQSRAVLVIQRIPVVNLACPAAVTQHDIARIHVSGGNARRRALVLQGQTRDDVDDTGDCI